VIKTVYSSFDTETLSVYVSCKLLILVRMSPGISGWTKQDPTLNCGCFYGDDIDRFSEEEEVPILYAAPRFMS